MKKVILLVVMLSVFLGIKTKIYAQTYHDEFYISDVIEGISYAKVKNGVTEYRRAKFKRRKSDNQIVYCIEPFVGLVENTKYQGYDANYEQLLKMSKEDWQRVNLISYYGYGYSNHTAEKWYAITQIMIWKVIDKNATFYWTDTFKGNKVIKYEAEMNEINNLVAKHKQQPSFANTTINMSIDSTINIIDSNNVLDQYEIIASDNLTVQKEKGELIVTSNDKAGSNTIKLLKKDNRHLAPPIIYVSNTYQNVLSVGSYDSITSSLNIITETGKCEITKIDSDSKDIIPKPNTSLKGAVYDLYLDGKKITSITIGDNNKGYANNLKFGDYKLVEVQAGTGYQVDKNVYYFSIDENNKEIKLLLENSVIKNKIKIYKYYQLTESEKKLESGITFSIFNEQGELIKEITTNDDGTAEFELDYGKYTVKQKNTTDGYYKVDDFTIEVLENCDNVKEYYLNDLKVPDTNENANNISGMLIIMIPIISLRYYQYVKKKI